MTRLFHDLRFGLRHFRRTPVTTITMILVLAIGIGVNSALFIVLSSVTSRPPAGISRDKALVRIRTLQRSSRGDVDLFQRDASYPEFQDYAARTDLFATVIATSSTDAVLDGVTEGGGPAAVPVEFVSPGYFAALGVRLEIGAGLPSEQAGASSPEPVVVIGTALWNDRFHAAADVVGKTLRLGGVSLTVVGVAPWPFGGTGGGTTLWVPLSLRPTILRGGFGMLSSRDSLLLTLFARMRPGVNAERATGIVQTIARRSNEAISPDRRPFLGTADLVPIRIDNRYPDEEKDLREVAAAAATVTLLILVITCLNVSALLVGSGVARSGEIAIRRSLGAPRSRIVRQLLTENAVIALGGGTLGLLLLRWLLATSQLTTSTGGVDLTVGWDTTLFTLVFAIGTAILFGVSPALHATRVSASETMKRSATHAGTSRSRLQRAFVIAQIALTQPLLVGLGIMLGDVIHQLGHHEAPGIRDRIIPAEIVWTNGRQWDTTTAAALALEDRFRGVPGVVAVVRQPNEYHIDRFSVHPADRKAGANDEKINTRVDGVAPGYFALMDIPIVLGRDFTTAEQRDPNAVIIGSDLAHTLWGSANPIGKRLQSWHWGEESIMGSQTTNVEIESSMPSRSGAPRTLTIVGVVDAAMIGKSNDPHQIHVFVPTAVPGSILIRTRGPGEATLPVLRAIANKEFPQLPLGTLQTLAQRDADERRDLLQSSAFAAGAGMLILLLASVGLYGVVAFAVGQRRREIGIRIALGAAPRSVVGMFLRGGVLLAAFGLAIGLPMTLAAMRILSHTIGFPHLDVLPVMTAIALVVSAVSLLATWLPARRAARVDPMLALRAE
jgi:predicted permease